MAVELRLGEIRAGQLQDLVGLAQFAHLALEFLDALLIGGGRTGPRAAVALASAHPLEDRPFKRTLFRGAGAAIGSPEPSVEALSAIFVVDLRPPSGDCLVEDARQTLGSRVYPDAYASLPWSSGAPAQPIPAAPGAGPHEQ